MGKKNILEAYLWKPQWSQFLLTWERWNSPPLPVGITSYPFPSKSHVFWDYKLSLHDVSEGGKNKVSLCCWIEVWARGKIEWLVCEEMFIVAFLKVEAINIKAWL